jgi:hypothetical protein
MIRSPMPRWALSFTDLCLVLLGFFIILHVQASHQSQLASGLRTAFGSGVAHGLDSHDLDPARLFERHEAVLLPAARTMLAGIGRDAARRGADVRIESIGVDPATHRFDAWELAAARTTAIARAVAAGGLDERRIALSIPQMAAPAPSERQRLAVVIIPRKQAGT